MKKIPQFLKDLMKFIAACGLLLGILIPVLAQAQVSTNFWKLSSNILSPILSTWTLQVTNQGSDPTGSNGAIYYNTGSGVFRCFAGGSWVNCSSGSSGTTVGTWSTSTSQVAGHFVNFPNNTTDVVVIGASATTSANYYIDPNINFAFLKYASTTAITANDFFTVNQTATGNSTLTNATTTSLAITNVASGLLKVNANGSVLLATPGTDYTTFPWMFGSTNSYGQVTISTTTGIQSQGGYFSSSTAASQLPYASSTAFTAATLYGTNLNVTGNTSLVNATTTSLFSSTASTSAFYGANLGTCPIGLMMRWSGGSFSCIGISGEGTSPWATTTSQVPSILTIAPLNNTDIVTIGSNSTTTSSFYVDPNTATMFFGTTTAGNSTIVLGSTNHEWSIGSNATGNLFQVSSSTNLGTNNALSVDKNLLVTIGNASTTQLSSSVLYASNLNSGNCLQASTGGEIIDTGSACGSGGGGSQTPWTANESAAGFSLNNLNVLNTNTFNATSTTGTSTVTNAFQIGGVNGDHMVSITPARNYSPSFSVGGAVRIDNSSNTGSAVNIFSNQASPASGAVLLNFDDQNASNANDVIDVTKQGPGLGMLINCSNTGTCPDLLLKTSGTTGGAYNLKLQGFSPQIEWNDTNLVAPRGQWETAVDPFGDFFYISARNAADTTYLNGENFSVYPARNGGRMASGTTTPYSSFSVQATSTIYAIVSSSSPVMDIAGTTSKPYLLVSNYGNIGTDGTTSPGTTLAAGTGSNFINISDNSTSTFSQGINLTGGCIAVNGVCIAGSAGSVSSVANGDGTLSISPTTGNVVAGLNLGHSNTWLTLQTFSGGASTTNISANYASSTIGVFGSATLGNVTGVSSNCLQADINGKITGSGGACGTGTVNNVSNSDGSLTISPTTGNVVGSLNPGHSNSWTALQTFANATSTLFSSSQSWLLHSFLGTFDATSTTGTSTIAGGLSLTRTQGQSIMTIVPGGDIGSSAAQEGQAPLAIDNTLNTQSPGLYVSSDQAGVPANPLVIFRSTDPAYNQGLLWLEGSPSNTGGAAYGLRIQDGNPDIEMYTGNQSPVGAYEMDVNNDLFRINGRNTADNSFDTIAWFSRFDKTTTAGGGRFCLGCGFVDLPSSLFNIVGTTTEGLPRFTVSSASTTANTGDQFIVTNTGNVGISTTTPGAKFGVQGNQFIAGNITSTSTIASIFPYASSTYLTSNGLTVNLPSNAVAQLNDNSSASAIWGTNIGFISGAGLGKIVTNTSVPLTFNISGTRNSMTSGTEVARFTVGGAFDVGTTSSYALGQIYSASSSAPQIALGDTGASTLLWTERTAGGNLYFATSTQSGTTSTVPWMQVDTNGVVAINGVASTTKLIVSGTATTSITGGVNLVGTDCFAVQGTCLQTLVSSASAYKQAVKYASTSTLPANTYNNGTGGVGATITSTALAPLFIDGNTAALGDRILVKNEATGANNGIYTVTTTGVSGVAAFVLTRATDYNSSSDVFPGVASFTNSGTVNANTCWILTNTSAVTIGTTALTYDDACGAGSYTGTSPIVVTGTNISFAAPASSALSIPYASSTAITSGVLYASSPTATSLFNGALNVGATANSPYLQIGSTTPVAGTGNVQGDYELTIGNDNTIFGIQKGITNLSPGTSAYSFFYFNNDKTDSTATHYAGFQYNSSNYSDTTFGTELATSTSFQMWNTDGPIQLIASTSTWNGYISFNTGGANTNKEIARFTNIGNFGLSTTTPGSKLSVQGNEFIAGNITSTSTVASVLPYASTTAITSSGNSYFITGGIGAVGIGTSTPWGELSIASTTYGNTQPLFTVSTSSNPFGSLFNIFATTSVMNTVSTSSTTPDIGVRVGIGTFSFRGFGGLLDQFVVKGRINTEGWNNANCDVITAAGGNTAQFIGGCPAFLGSSSNFSSELLNQPAAGGFSYAAVNLPANTAINTGVGIVMAEQQFGSPWMIPATTTPVMEINARIEFPQNSTSTLYYIGFDDNSKSGAFTVTTPSNGCYFIASSTLANWQAVASNSATKTTIDTGIASSTVLTGRGGFYKFRIEASNALCNFYIQPGETASMANVASITTNVPSTHALHPNIWITNSGAALPGLQNSLDFNHFRVWWKDFLPPGGN